MIRLEHSIRYTIYFFYCDTCNPCCLVEFAQYSFLTPYTLAESTVITIGKGDQNDSLSQRLILACLTARLYTPKADSLHHC